VRRRYAVRANPRSRDVRLLQRFIDSAEAALAAEGLPVQRERYEKLAQAARNAANLGPEDLERLLKDLGIEG
jgi:hypothetical protein